MDCDTVFLSEFAVETTDFGVTTGISTWVSKPPLERVEFHGGGSSLEYSLRDAVLPVLVSQVELKDVWQWVQPQEHPVTFGTLDSLRGTSSSWKSAVEGTAEWGALALARFEFQALVPPLWTDEEEYVLFRFEKHRGLFGRSWWLQHPLSNDHWRTAPFGALTVVDLAGLSSALEEGSEECVQWTPSSRLHPQLNLWLTPADRAGHR